MSNEAYEMTRSQSNASTDDQPNGEYDDREQETRLLNKEGNNSEDEQDDEDDDLDEEDEEWAIIVDENAVDGISPEYRVKCPFIFCSSFDSKPNSNLLL